MRKKVCLVCHSDKVKSVGKIDFNDLSYSKKTKLMVCQKCLFHFTEPLPNEKKLSKIYSQVYHYDQNKFVDTFLQLWTLQVLKSDRNLIEKYQVEGRILDVGAGRGDFLSTFPSNNWERWAYDPYLSRKDEKLLMSKIGKHVNDYDELGKYPANSFDVIALRNVIEHTSKFKKLLRNCQRVLKKGGILFIRTPNIDSLDFRIFKTNWYVIRMPGHLVYFGKKSIKKVLYELGLGSVCFESLKRSTLLSYYRSVKESSKILSLLKSVIFSGYSYFCGEGADLRVIAKK